MDPIRSVVQTGLSEMLLSSYRAISCVLSSGICVTLNVTRCRQQHLCLDGVGGSGATLTVEDRSNSCCMGRSTVV